MDKVEAKTLYNEIAVVAAPVDESSVRGLSDAELRKVCETQMLPAWAYHLTYAPLKAQYQEKVLAACFTENNRRIRISVAPPPMTRVQAKPKLEEASANTGGPNQVATHETESSSPRFWTVVLSAVVDGSEAFIFTEDAVIHVHKSQGPPTNVLFNGKPWENLERTPDEWTEHRGKLDLKRAYYSEHYILDISA